MAAAEIEALKPAGSPFYRSGDVGSWYAEVD